MRRRRAARWEKTAPRGPPAEEGSCERFRAPAVGGPIEVAGLGVI